MDYNLEAMPYGMQFRRLIEKQYEPIESRYGLYKIDMQVLLYLDSAGACNTSKDILKLNMFTKGHISQALRRLHKKGYIKVEQDIDDRRYAHNLITEEAEQIIKELRSISDKVRRITLEGVTDEERKVLAIVAEKVSKNISKVI